MTNAKLDLQVVFKSMDSSDAVKEYAEKRVEKIVKHIHEMTRCHFVFEIEKLDHVAQLHVNAGDFDAKAEGRADNMYKAIDMAKEKILQQSRKFKEKATDHTGRPHHNQD